jgi:phage tail-like protein
MGTDQAVSTYLAHLPPVLQEGELIGRFLLAFEAVLTGFPDAKLVGLDQRIDRLYSYFDPDKAQPFNAPTEFLPWLAQWVATSLRDDWSEEVKRDFIRQIVPLYQQRGTRAGLEAVLRICAGDVQVIEFAETAGKPAHYFQVTLTLLEDNPVLLARRARMVQAMVEREKPAHTFYGLVIMYPAMRINNNPAVTPAYGKGITVGVNTALGTSLFTPP